MLISSRIILNNPLMRVSFGIVNMFKRERKSVFDCTEYNENWLPRIRPYHKKRKPRQAAWTDPNVEYPKLIPPMHPKMHPRIYLKSV